MRKFQNISFIIILLSSFILAFETKAMEDFDNEQTRSIASKQEEINQDETEEDAEGLSVEQGLSIEQLKGIREELRSDTSPSQKIKLLEKLAAFFDKGNLEDAERAALVFLEVSYIGLGGLPSSLDWIFCKDGEFRIEDKNGYTYTDQQQLVFWEVLAKVIQEPDEITNSLNSIRPESWETNYLNIKNLQKTAEEMLLTLTYTYPQIKEFVSSSSQIPLSKILVEDRIQKNPESIFSVKAAFNIYSNLLKTDESYLSWIETLYMKKNRKGYKNAKGTRMFLETIGFYLQKEEEDCWSKDLHFANYVSKEQQKSYEKDERKYRLVAAAHAYLSFLENCSIPDIATWILPYINPVDFTPEAKETIKLVKTIKKNKK